MGHNLAPAQAALGDEGDDEAGVGQGGEGGEEVGLVEGDEEGVLCVHTCVRACMRAYRCVLACECIYVSVCLRFKFQWWLLFSAAAGVPTAYNKCRINLLVYNILPAFLQPWLGRTLAHVHLVAIPPQVFCAYMHE